MSRKALNPISGAFSASLGGAACVAVGSAIRQHNTHQEALIQLAGGAINGAIAGTIALCMPYDSMGSGLKSGVGSVLSIAASLTAPLMGELVLKYGAEAGPIVVDNLIGSSVFIAAGLVAACCIGGLGLGCAIATNKKPKHYFDDVKSFFGKEKESSKSQQNTSQNQVSPV